MNTCLRADGQPISKCPAVGYFDANALLRGNLHQAVARPRLPEHKTGRAIDSNIVLTG